MVVLAETVVTAQVHNRGQLSVHDQNVAAMFSLELAAHWGQRCQLIQMSFDGPVAGSTQHPEFLKGNRLQAFNHLPPLGSKGRRASPPPADVAVTGTVCWVICWSRIFWRFSGSASRVSRKVCNAWKMLAITM